MAHNWGKLQTVDINQDNVPCSNCGANIVDICNIKYNNEAISEPLYREELCQCRACMQSFVLHYDLFDKKGHIYHRVFAEDANNLSFNWPDLLADNQKEVIKKHLETCDICRERVSKQQLHDAWFASVIHSLAS